jgi:hypothetical protein
MLRYSFSSLTEPTLFYNENWWLCLLKVCVHTFNYGIRNHLEQNLNEGYATVVSRFRPTHTRNRPIVVGFICSEKKKKDLLGTARSKTRPPPKKLVQKETILTFAHACGLQYESAPSPSKPWVSTCWQAAKATPKAGASEIREARRRKLLGE